MNLNNFYPIGSFYCDGELVILSPTDDVLNKNFKPFKVKLPKGDYEVLSASIERHDDKSNPHTFAVTTGFLIKPLKAKAKFEHFTEIPKNNLHFAVRKVAVMTTECFSQLNEKKVETMIWAPLNRPKSNLLVKDELNEYGWWVDVHVGKDYIVGETTGSNQDYYVYKSKNALLVTFKDATELALPKYKFQKTQRDFFKIRATAIRYSLVQNKESLIELNKLTKVTKEKALARVLNFGHPKEYGPKTIKMLEKVIEKVYAKTELPEDA